MTDAFRLDGVAFSYGRAPVLRDLGLALPAGAFTALVGPNGSGKTTLLSLLGGLLRPGRGRVLLEGRPVGGHRPRELARRVALVPQDTGIDFPFTVREVVSMGRYPHVPRFASPSARDFAAVEAAVEELGLAALAETPVTQLSGGERQRVVLARALAQEAPVLLLDEATSHLDVHHALDILDQLRRRVRAGGLTVVAVMHDLNLAAAHADRMVFLDGGAVAAEGGTGDVFREDVIDRVFGVRSAVQCRPGGGPYALFDRAAEAGRAG